MQFRKRKTRFAPSPTGIMHIGNLRAAVLSYLWSLKNDAEFVLRIDDTDRERSKENLTEYIKEDLAWLGISWASTFKQSDRSNLYREIMEKCIACGLVYEVYETEDELEQIRKDLSRKKLPPAYKKFEDRRRGEDREKYWRFDLGKSIVQFEDRIRGKIEIDLSSTSDPVICKNNRDFTYIFASVVDDLDCEISTIIRASDHISNTATQLLMIRKMLEHKIFETLEPEFAHYPLFVHESKEKLSKRNKSMSIDELKSIHPLAICHFLYVVGNNQKIQAQKSLPELAKSFRFEDYSKSNTTEFSKNYLLNWQKKVISVLDSAEIQAWTGVSFGENWWIIKDCIENREDIFYWKEILQQKRAFCLFSEGKDLPKENNIDSREEVLKILKETENQKKLSEELKIKLLSIRQILTGRNFGPKLGELMKAIPEEIIDFRISNYQNFIFKLYNSLSGHQEIFKAIDPLKVRLYACGPTLYGLPHIGNARSFVIFDLLYRLLKFEYKQVVFARNITDIDDKIINRAHDMKISPTELVEQIYPQFRQQMRDLNVLEPTFEPRVTQFLPQIIDCIERMLQSGYAYHHRKSDKTNWGGVDEKRSVMESEEMAGTKSECRSEGISGDEEHAEMNEKEDGIYFKIAKVSDYKATIEDYKKWGRGDEKRSGMDCEGEVEMKNRCEEENIDSEDKEHAEMNEKEDGIYFKPGMESEEMAGTKSECRSEGISGDEEHAEMNEKEDGIYFKIAKVSDYNLFHICGESESDFALWKFRQKDEIGWESPWGWGRPGWHIECTAMSEAILGLPFDLHLGGMDLKFPHHTNECAQACGMGFPKTANYWIHSNFINVDKLKMSKSLNNFLTLSDLDHHPMIIRTAFLGSHYRQQLPWSEDLLQEASTLYNKWRRCIGKSISHGANPSGYPLTRVLEALNSDLNTPLALKTLDAAISESNAGDLLASFDLLGISFNFGYLNDRSIKALVDERQKARSEGNFKLADEIRDKLSAIEVELEEGKEIVNWYQRIK